MYAQMLFLLKRLDAPDIILTYIWLLRTHFIGSVGRKEYDIQL